MTHEHQRGHDLAEEAAPARARVRRGKRAAGVRMNAAHALRGRGDAHARIGLAGIREMRVPMQIKGAHKVRRKWRHE